MDELSTHSVGSNLSERIANEEDLKEQPEAFRGADEMLISYGERSCGSLLTTREMKSSIKPKREFCDMMFQPFCSDGDCIIAEGRMFEILILIQGKGEECIYHALKVCCGAKQARIALDHVRSTVAEIQKKFFFVSEDHSKNLIFEDTLKLTTNQALDLFGKILHFRFDVKRSFCEKRLSKLSTLNTCRLSSSSGDSESIKIFRNSSCLDDSNLYEVGCENFEGVGGETNYKDSSDLSNEIYELNFQNGKLADEVARFKVQALQSEEMYQHVLQENEKLKRRIANLLVNLDRMKELQERCDELKSSYQNLEISKLNLHLELETIQKEKNFLEEDNMLLLNKLSTSNSEVDLSKHRERELLESLSDQSILIEEFKSRNKELESLLKDKSLQCEELESIIKTLSEGNEALRYDIGKLDIQLARSKDEKIRMQEFCKTIYGKYQESQSADENLNLSQLFESDQNSPVSEEGMATTTIARSYQECFMYHLSLGTEIRNSVSLREELPTPFCGKFTFLCGSDTSESQVAAPQTSIKIKNVEKETSVLVSEVEKLSESLKSVVDQIRVEWKLLKSVNDETKFLENTEIDGVKTDQTPCAEEVAKCSDIQESREQNITPDIWDHVETNSAEHNLVMGLSTNDVREQMNIEIKALRAQIIRSHALLSYLTKEKETLSATQKSTLEISNQQIPPLERKSEMGFFQQRSLDGQIISHKSRCCLSHRSHKSTPLHKLWFSNSCPFLLSETSATSRSTQTELVSISESPVRSRRRVASTSSGNECFLRAQHVTNSLRNTANVEVLVQETVPSSRTTSENAPIVSNSGNEVQNFNGNELPLSPIFARNRTYSFLTAVFKGNPNLVDASLNSSYQSDINNVKSRSVEEQHYQVRDNNDHPYFGSSSEIRKDYTLTNIYSTKHGITHAREGNLMDGKTKEHETSSENPRKERIAEPGTKDVNFREGTASSDEPKSKSEKPSDKSFKTPQRSMRRGSGTGSPNSLTTIPRCPAFDFSEQDEEQSLVLETSSPKPDKSVNPQAILVTNTSKDHDVLATSPTTVKDVRHKKSDSGKSMTLMPDLMENSETESAKGSFECEAPEMPLAEIPTIAISEVPSFPSLAESFLQKLGVHKESSSIPESFGEQELEAKFNTLSLAFKTDKLTLTKRLELQKRQRDIAEKNVENEIQVLRESLNDLNLNVTSSEARDLLSKIQNHIDIIQQATSRMSGRSEIYGAVQQIQVNKNTVISTFQLLLGISEEERVSKAFEVLVLHVENLKRMLDKERRDLEEARRILSGTKELNVREAGADETKKSLRAVTLAVGSLRSQTVRRRASVAVLHSSPDGFKPRSMSTSWTAGFPNIKTDTRSHQPSVLNPFSLTSSVGQNSNSTSASLSAPLPSPSGRAHGPMSRRSSLPTSEAGENFTGINVPKSSESRDKSVLKVLNQDQNHGELSMNTSRKLYSLSDEGETEQEELCYEVKDEVSLVEDEDDDVLPSPFIPPSSDSFSARNESEHSDEDKYCLPRTFNYRPEGNWLSVLRYSFSGFLIILALLCLFVTVLPCLASIGDSKNIQVLEAIFQPYIVVKHIDRPV